MSRSIPKHISANLRHELRPYQETALSKWLDYAENLSQNSRQILFQMATGSGKTLIMAAIILDLYRRGLRNFIFFVGSTNILEKTRDNFLHSHSPKYLFAKYLTIDGKYVPVREVETFASSDQNAINLIFTTTQRLHSDLHHPHENRLTFDDLRDYDFVLIGDEAHHNNAKLVREDARTWEETVEKLSRLNPHALLLEFTATMNFQNPTISKKYHDRLLFHYDLSKFRSEKYSKDVLIYSADCDLRRRFLQAIIISEYRKLVATKYQIVLKPVVLFKSRTVVENKNNFRQFVALMATLKSEDILAEKSALEITEHDNPTKIKPSAENILAKAFQFFDQENLSAAKLCQKIQADFHPDYCLRIDGSQKLPARTQHLINTLESPENPYRAIFAVDMLKEGWDVLNLFDIVRLYEIKNEQSKTAGDTTLSEAQLIGRGARYFPFDYQTFPRALRKFDDQPDHELRALEQLHYHTSRDVKYISDIQHALDDTGITEFFPV